MRHQKDEQIGRNILKIDSQLENNNQNHRKTKRVMPFQGRGSDFSLHCLVQKVLIPLKSKPDCPGLQFWSDTRAHCLNTGQPSSRCLFLNRVAVHRHVAASQQCFKAKLGYHKIQMAARPGDGMAGVDCEGRCPRPGETTGRYSIFFFVERFNSPLSGESHSNPSQTARPGAYGQGSDTRAHRDCLNLNLPPDFSIGWLYVAT